jgi:hypothetical protein
VRRFLARSVRSVTMAAARASGITTSRWVRSTFCNCCRMRLPIDWQGVELGSKLGLGKIFLGQLVETTRYERALQILSWFQGDRLDPEFEPFYREQAHALRNAIHHNGVIPSGTDPSEVKFRLQVSVMLGIRVLMRCIAPRWRQASPICSRYTAGRRRGRRTSSTAVSTDSPAGTPGRFAPCLACPLRTTEPPATPKLPPVPTGPDRRQKGSAAAHFFARLPRAPDNRAMHSLACFAAPVTDWAPTRDPGGQR